jgi:translation initiation factor IF-1
MASAAAAVYDEKSICSTAHSRMIETSGVIEKEQGNGFYLVTLEQPAGHQCLCRAAGKLTKFRIKLLAGDKVLVEISPYDLSRGRITYRERNAGATGPRPGGNRPGGPRRR